jgi:malonyl-CoA/methylmalonyl-CoA synthetase
VSEALPPIVARTAAHRARTAIIDGHKTYSYEDLERASADIASDLVIRCGGFRLPAFAKAPAGLAKARVHQASDCGEPDLGEARVAFLVAPSFEHVAIQWGIWRSGGIAVPLPMSHTAAEVEYLIRDCEASMVIADAAHANALAPIAESVGAQFLTIDELSTAAGLKPCATEATSPEATSPRRPVSTLAASTVAQGFGPARRAMIVYTSGTTSRPKGVVTTHANITAQVESLVTAWEWMASDRTLLVLPLHHVHGIINVACCALWSGAALEIHPRFDSETTWDRLASGELTVFTAVPTIYHRLIQSWEAASPRVRAARSEGCRSLRLMMSGSAALPRTVLDEWAQITGHVLLERYGMTEVGMALSNPLRGERRPGFVGHPLPGVSARLVDGELQLKGPGVFSEYWNRPDSTRDAFTDGWFRTGDVAVFEDGAYRLLGRSNVDIIKSGGDKISALEIEEVLRTHPAIGECAVVGVDDLEWGQRICCAVELQPGSGLELSDLRDWAKTRLAAYKIPKDLVCVPHLPRNTMGKVIKPEVSAFFARPAQPGRPDP